ncbi:hypothetical protein KUS72_004876 [Escherichia coli]|nr:hypothetical protein [Escherichia coli]EIM2920973.1 hypothetical protein [Escherichia coli]
MIKTNKAFVFLLCLLCSKSSMADAVWEPINEHKSVSKTFLVKNAVPDTWLNLGQFNIGTASTLSSGTSPCLGLNGMCTVGAIDLGYNGKASYILYFSRKEVTITDKSGKRYIVKLAFPDKAPVVGVYEHNNMGGKTWNTFAPIDNSLSSISDGNNTANATEKAQGYCGAISGCSYTIGSYIHDNSGMPSVYIKLPKNLSERSISFSDAEVLNLQLYISNKGHDTVSPTSAKLYLSGTISVPQRCYIKADKNSFDLGTVYSNAGNGVLKNISASITTDCYYAPDNTKQYLKMDAVSGGELDNKSMIYWVASEPALGIVFDINKTPQCNSTTENKNVFNKEYLIRSITYKEHLTATDTVNFALCKYGVPSVTGQKNVVLKITSRWVVN